MRGSNNTSNTSYTETNSDEEVSNMDSQKTETKNILKDEQESSISNPKFSTKGKGFNFSDISSIKKNSISEGKFSPDNNELCNDILKSKIFTSILGKHSKKSEYGFKDCQSKLNQCTENLESIISRGNQRYSLNQIKENKVEEEVKNDKASKLRIKREVIQKPIKGNLDFPDIIESSINISIPDFHDSIPNIKKEQLAIEVSEIDRKIEEPEVKKKKPGNKKKSPQKKRKERSSSKPKIELKNPIGKLKEDKKFKPKEEKNEPPMRVTRRVAREKNPPEEDQNLDISNAYKEEIKNSNHLFGTFEDFFAKSGTMTILGKYFSSQSAPKNTHSQKRNKIPFPENGNQSHKKRKDLGNEASYKKTRGLIRSGLQENINHRNLPKPRASSRTKV